jgi:hypothetical protein
MSDDNGYQDLPTKEQEREERRGKKRRPGWKISGRGVFTLVKIIRSKGEGKEPLEPRQKKRRRRPKKK